MSEIAFYAPLKPPDHPTPSGDRAMARALMQALGPVTLTSDLRSRDAVGNAEVQAALFEAANAEVARLIALGKTAGWRVLVTYHNYYKAPDLIGPAVARALGLPYVQIESTRARRRLNGPWRAFARAAEAATDQAALVFHLTHRDREALEAYKCGAQRIVYLPPFLDSDLLEMDRHAARRPGRQLLSVAMMRGGDKLASYQVLAASLAQIADATWRLEIVGDGPARAQVEALFGPFGDRVRFLGALDRDQLALAFARADLFVWPGVNEAFGMVYLEAQAFGLPVLAQDRPGVRDVVHGGVLTDPQSETAFAVGLTALLEDAEKRSALGAAGRAAVRAQHTLPAARAVLQRHLQPLMTQGAA